MSDLDADLYGDLYGNDEGETEQPTEENDSHPAEETQVAEEAPSVKVETPEVKSTPAEKPQTNGTTTLQPPATNGATQSTYTQPAPQQIPTYEQPLPNEYREMPIQRVEGGYQNMSSAERSVRPSEMKDEGKMFIGGLNWDTTDEGLRDYFSQFGKVDACTIMRDAAGRSRCFAFLTFEDPASVNAVMVREHYLDGKIIDPKRAIPRQEHQRATKLFIGGLAGSVTSESMREFFSQFGKVIDSTVMLDRDTGRSKGFGFISFEDTNVQPFLGFGNLEIDGKLIDVKLAQPRYQRDNFPHEEAAAAASGNEYGAAAATAPRFNAQQNNFANPVAGAVPGAAGNTPFDPQALAALYTRMFQMSGAGGMNPGMMGGMGGGMNPMMGGMGAAGGFPGGMRPGMGMGMGMGGMAAGGHGMGGMGRGGMMAGGGMNQNIPRGPRGGGGGGGGPGGMGASVGPQRSQRGGHNFHPYAR
ncbi:RNA-binding domain-containing protein [Agrocybe pediades]|nr:RNA-binding domain-containing protein [Agrocybe pediades]